MDCNSLKLTQPSIQFMGVRRDIWIQVTGYVLKRILSTQYICRSNPLFCFIGPWNGGLSLVTPMIIPVAKTSRT